LDPNATLFRTNDYHQKKRIDRAGCLVRDHSGYVGCTGGWEKDVGGGVGSEDTAGGVQPPPLLSVASFGGDGSFTTAGNTKFPQGLDSDERGPGYGRWAQTGDREFKLTFYAVLLKKGEVNAYLRVHSTMILSDSGNEFTARECQGEFLDTNWKVLDSDNDEVKGTRLETP
jgi:hypothetical protein